MMKSIIKLITILITFTFLIAESVGNENEPVPKSRLGWLTVYRGIMPNELSNGPIAPLSNPDGIDAIVIQSDDILEILAFHGVNDWGTLAVVPVTKDTRFCWDTGPILNVKNDQLICTADSCVTIYNLDKDLRKYSVMMPYIVDDLEVGDIDNDGISELVTLSIGEQTSRSSVNYHLVIAKIDSCGLKSIWDDNSSLNLGYHKSMPKQKIMCIADIKNMGTNMLVIMGSQSDMGPSNYKTYQWNDNKLIETGTFSFVSENLEVSSYIAEYILFGNIKTRKYDKTVFLGKLLKPPEMLGDTFILAIEDTNLVIIDKCFDGWRDNPIWVDLDGNGTGVLRVWKNYGYPKLKYHYYRPST